MPDQEFEAILGKALTGTDWRKKALDKIGLDESEVREIEPVRFEGYVFDGNVFVKRGKDGVWRSSAYQLTWLFFSSTQVYVWQNTFNLNEGGKKERTEEYFYKDITNFSAQSDTEEKETLASGGCMGSPKVVREQVHTNRFQLTVPGEKLFCSMQQNEYTEKSIQGMKAKLREKKNA
ncbi:hypothetical protein [Geothrix sp.]|uniref:hypothetical protein n=1 Tax=Geothrix sp. TaxID=1962974 RepID=UPI00260F06BD|nr:hypothetical protein [Geothrix sp.]WIL21299.1 MAG: hypothetical protein QOZ81_000553 [Geothrix sp.]